MKVCEHEYENANCTNCANGLPILAYECAKTRGKLKEYCHNKAEDIRKQIRAEAIDELSDLIDRLLWEYDIETYNDLSESFKESARLLKEIKQ